MVDWKTGRKPTGPAADAAAVQLAAYRLAWAALAGVPVDRVGRPSSMSGTGCTVRPADLLDQDGLARLISALPATDGTERPADASTESGDGGHLTT